MILGRLVGERVYGAVALVATLLLSSVAGVGVAAPTDGGTRGSNDAGDLRTGAAANTTTDAQRGDWRPHDTIGVRRNGTATVTTRLEGPDAPSELWLYFDRGELLSVADGSEGLERNERYFDWDVSEAEQVSFRVRLGVQTRPVNTGTFDGAVLFALSEVAPVNGGERFGSLPAAHRFTVEAPEGWSVAAPGRQVGPNTYEVFPQVTPDTFPREMVPVGNFDVATRAVGDSEIRVATVPSVEPGFSSAEAADFLAEVTPALADIYGTEIEYGRMLAITPEGFENGALARHHSVIVSARSPLYDVNTSRSVYAHEMAHTYQRFRGANRHSEGQASYVQTLALYEAGITDESEYRRMLQTWITTPRAEVGDPVQSAAAGSVYFKRAAVYAALDADSRARTDGEHDSSDFIAATADQSDQGDRDSYERRFDVLRSGELRVLEGLTGKNYTSFYERFVDGPEIPDELLGSDFSLSEAKPIESGELTVELLQSRLAERDERIAELESRPTNEDLREQLNGTQAESEELRERIEELEENGSSAPQATPDGADSGGAGHGFGAIPGLVAVALVATALLVRHRRAR